LVGAGVRGGTSRKSRREADAFAERLRPVFLELAGKPLRRIVAELQARKIAAPPGDWSPAQVSRTLRRLVCRSSGGPVRPSVFAASNNPRG
jgi:hypothetical protein